MKIYIVDFPEDRNPEMFEETLKRFLKNYRLLDETVVIFGETPDKLRGF